MAKNKKTKRTRIEGERQTIFYTKGKTTIRVRLFPSPNGSRVSVVRTESDGTKKRSVQEFSDAEASKEHMSELGDKAEKAGYSVRVGTSGDNASLFE